MSIKYALRAGNWYHNVRIRKRMGSKLSVLHIASSRRLVCKRMNAICHRVHELYCCIHFRTFCFTYSSLTRKHYHKTTFNPRVSLEKQGGIVQTTGSNPYNFISLHQSVFLYNQPLSITAGHLYTAKYTDDHGIPILDCV